MIPPDGGPLTKEGVAALRQRLSDSGFAWCPQITGKKNGDKVTEGWRNRPEGFDPQHEYANAYGPQRNTALILTGVWAWDIDVDDPADVAGIMAVLITHLGEPPCRRYRPGSARTACLWRQDTEAAYAGLQGSDGAIEVFSGSQAKLAAFGLHENKITKVRTTLTWDGVPGNRPLAEMPAITEDQVLDALAACGDWLGDDVNLTRRLRIDGRAGDPVANNIDALCDALACIPNAATLSWQEWNRIGMAMYAGSGGDERGLLAFAEWTLKSVSSKHRDWLGRWLNYDTCPPTAIGAGTIFHLAKQFGYVKPPLSYEAKKQWSEEQNKEMRRRNWKPKI